MTKTEKPRDDWMDRGRVRQKRRTRAELLAATAAIIQQGRTPTIAEAAKGAGVSRATAYRYFPTQEALLVEVAIDIAMPTPERLFDADDGAPEAEDRVALAERAVHEMCYDNEPQIRMFLRASIDRWFNGTRDGVPMRQGRRLRLIEAALRPVRRSLGKERYDRLTAALTIIIGFESMIALSDVLQLERDRAGAVTGWAARALVRAALDEAAGTGRARGRDNPR